MAAASTGVMTDEAFTVLAQIFGAFAQGAEDLFIDPPVILQAREDYAGPIERRLEHWHTEGPLTLLLTRALGRHAAHLALAANRTTIALEDYQQAQSAMRAAGRCPFHMARRHA